MKQFSGKIVSRMTYTVLSGTLNPYCIIPHPEIGINFGLHVYMHCGTAFVLFTLMLIVLFICFN